VALAACGEDVDSRLEVLRADPLAQVSVPGAVDARHTEREGGGSITGFESPTSVQTTFYLPTAASRDDAVELLADAAREAGWELEPSEYGGYSGFREVEGLSVQAIIRPSSIEPRVSVELSTRD
jgi:hypothetical protein